MRVRVDRGAGAVHIALGEAAEVRRADVVEGVAVGTDADGRIVGIEVRGVDPAALQEVAVDLAGIADRPAALPAAPPRPAPAPAEPPQAPLPYGGPVGWDAEAEAAMLQVPFFSRGRLRLAAVALARQRGLDRVSLDIVRAVGR